MYDSMNAERATKGFDIVIVHCLAPSVLAMSQAFSLENLFTIYLGRCPRLLSVRPLA
jgi:hypothetical protein